MVRYVISVLALLLLGGCAQEVPISKRDLDFARTDLELEKARYRTFAGSKERSEIEERIDRHRTDWEFDLDEGKNHDSKSSRDDESRIRQFNKMFEDKLRQAQQPAQ